jgi:hypothetical protein
MAPTEDEDKALVLSVFPDAKIEVTEIGFRLYLGEGPGLGGCPSCVDEATAWGIVAECVQQARDDANRGRRPRSNFDKAATRGMSRTWEGPRAC